jgi:hypothetical protein
MSYWIAWHGAHSQGDALARLSSLPALAYVSSYNRIMNKLYKVYFIQIFRPYLSNYLKLSKLVGSLPKLIGFSPCSNARVWVFLRDPLELYIDF